MTQQVRKSKTELTGPNTAMKFRMNFMSQAAGRARASGSTRSVGMTSRTKAPTAPAAGPARW